MTTKITCKQGHPNPAGNAFCAVCGSELEPDPAQVEIPTRGRRRTRARIAVAVIALIAIGTVIWASSSESDSSDHASTFSDLPIERQVMIRIRAADPNAMQEHSETEWLSIISNGCDLLGAGHSLAEIMANLEAAGATISVRDGLRAGLETQCPELVDG